MRILKQILKVSVFAALFGIILSILLYSKNGKQNHKNRKRGD
ncbi:hypothetical protein MmiEs2_00880 [Methanimicrococcus stummii]|uniref:Uncharacterized protein n=1 Tax=Methanimicrococcus stummii TaxID=3028294 RepID=A0AA96V739_9EURY|nr:hypothetical protein [Methanimicrococcus sp. Es2]WNY27909.1 hypothetical protein MmiEs2_00880 [Methanimicrococcus sp. Es2]